MANFEEKCQYFVDDFVYVDVDNSTHFFCRRINQIYCNSFPLKIKHISHKRFKNAWLSSEIMRSIKIKSKLYKNFKLGFVKENYYKRFKNDLTKTIRRAKKSYYVSKFIEYKMNVKMTWKIINDLIEGKKTKGIFLRLLSIILRLLMKLTWLNDFVNISAVLLGSTLFGNSSAC